MDNDLREMSDMQLIDEVMKLREGIRKHRDQKADENCWLDDQFYLYGLLPEKIHADPQLPDKDLMMINCSRYYDCRKAGKLYIPLTELPNDDQRNNPKTDSRDYKVTDGESEECT